MVIQGLPGDPKGRRGGGGGILEFRVKSWGLWSVSSYGLCDDDFYRVVAGYWLLNHGPDG